MIYYIETKCENCSTEEAMIITAVLNPFCGKCGKPCLITFQKEQVKVLPDERDNDI